MLTSVRFIAALLLFASGVMLPAGPADAGADDYFPVTPSTDGGRRWRIAYYQGGDYVDYKDSLLAVVKGLVKIGWIETEPLRVAEGEATEPLWRWLTAASSKHLEFIGDGFYNAEWDDARRSEIRTALERRLGAGGDIDLVIAMGTWAGKDLATDAHSTPTIVVSTSDAVSAQIINSVDDSGRDHVHAHVDPLRYVRQIRLFHDFAAFERLGVAYEETLEGRSYAAMEQVEQVAAERGFEIVRCHTPGDAARQTEADTQVLACVKYLAAKADALYVTIQKGVNPATLPLLLETAAAHNVRSFSQHGTDEVKLGVLLSMSSQSFTSVGLFQAEVIAKVLNGATPRRLDQIHEEPSKVALNMDTARDIGFVPPVYAIAVIDEIFGVIATPY